MATQVFQRGRYIGALRTIIQSLPLDSGDRTSLLATVEECARCAHNEREATGARRRPRKIITPEYRARKTAYMRQYRARKRAAAHLDG